MTHWAEYLKVGLLLATAVLMVMAAIAYWRRAKAISSTLRYRPARRVDESEHD